MNSEFSIRMSELIIQVITFDYFVIKRIIRKTFGNANRKSILDLGCGTGTLSVLFPRKSYLGVDIDKKLIDSAKKFHPGYSFQTSDATKIRLEKKFDIILVIGVIHHLSDKEVKKFVETIDFHLKISGTALIIEAIPPLFKWNILGVVDRKLDKGSFIRELDKYKKLLSGKLEIKQACNQLGGVADYGVLLVSKR